MKYIVICLSRSENESKNFRVDYNGKMTFDSLEEAEIAKSEDMKEYLKAETEDGQDAHIEGNRIEWDDEFSDCDREAEWYIYEV